MARPSSDRFADSSQLPQTTPELTFGRSARGANDQVPPVADIRRPAMIARMNTPADAFAQAANDLVGMELRHIWRGHGTALFLEFGKLSERLRRDGSTGIPRGEISVGLEFAWRIEVDRRLVCGSYGDQELWPEVFKGLLGKRASRVEIFGEVPELRIVLDERERVLTFALDDAGPEWALTDNRSSPPVWVYWRNGELRCDDGDAATWPSPNDRSPPS